MVRREMTARERTSIHKRRIIVLCAIILTAATMGLVYWRTPALDLAMLFIILPSVFFGLAASLSLYRPLTVVAIIGQVAAFYWPLGFSQLPTPAEGAGVASTGLLLSNLMLAGIGMTALTLVSVVLVIIVLFQRRWAPVVGTQY
jgi:flagellar biosynthesis protein FliR